MQSRWIGVVVGRPAWRVSCGGGSSSSCNGWDCRRWLHEDRSGTVASVRAHVEVAGARGAWTAYCGMSAGVVDAHEKRRLLGDFVQATCDLHGPEAGVALLERTWKEAKKDRSGKGVVPVPHDAVLASLWQAILDQGAEKRLAKRLYQTVVQSSSSSATTAGRPRPEETDSSVRSAAGTHLSTLRSIQALANAGETTSALLELSRLDHVADVGVLNTVMTAMAAANRMDDAQKVLAIFSTNQLRPTAGTFNALIRAQGRRGNVEGARKALELMKQSGFRPGLTTFNALMEAYTKEGDVAGVESVLEEMQGSAVGPNTLTYNTMLAACVKKRQADSADAVLDRMLRFQLPPNLTTFKLMAQVRFLADRASSVPELVAEMRDRYALQADAELYNALVHGYCGGGLATRAEEVLHTAQLEQVAITRDAVEDVARCQAGGDDPTASLRTLAEFGHPADQVLPTERTLVAIAAAFLRTGRDDDAAEALPLVRRGIHAAYGSEPFWALAVRALAKSTDADLLLRALEELRTRRPPLVAELTEVVATLVQENQLVKATALVKELGEQVRKAAAAAAASAPQGGGPRRKAEAAMNALLQAYCAEQDLAGALSVRRELERCDLRAEDASRAGLAALHAQRGQLEEARTLLARVRRADGELCHAVLAAHASVGDVPGCRAVARQLDRMGLAWEERTFAAMIEAHGRNRDVASAASAFEALLQAPSVRRTRPRGFVGGMVGHAALLCAYAENGAERPALQQLDRMRRLGLIPNADTYGRLVEMYLRQRKAPRANRILEQMRRDGVRPTEATMKALVHVCNREHDVEGARFAASELRRWQVSTDVVTYNEVLEVLAAHGDVQGIREVMHDMAAVGTHAPNSVSYAHLLAACGRARDRRTVLTVAATMPRNGVTATALLGALLACGDVSTAIRELNGLGAAVRQQPAVLNHALRAFALRGDFDRALQALQKLLAVGGRVQADAFQSFFDAMSRAKRGGSKAVSELLRNAGVDLSHAAFDEVVNARIHAGSALPSSSPSSTSRRVKTDSTSSLPDVSAAPTDVPKRPRPVGTEASLRRESRAGNWPQVVEDFRSYHRSLGRTKLSGDVSTSVVAAVARCGTVQDAILVLQGSVEVTPSTLPPQLVLTLVDRLVDADAVEGLVELVEALRPAGIDLGGVAAQKVLQVFVRRRHLLPLAARFVGDLRTMRTDMDSAALNGAYRLVLRAQTDANDLDGAQRTLQNLADRWDVDVEMETLYIVLHGLAARRQTDAIEAILRWLPLQSHAQLAAIYACLATECARRGNLGGARDVLRRLQQRGIQPPEDVLASICSDLERSGESRSALLLASEQKRP